MAVEFRPTRREEVSGLTQFLLNIFNLSPDAAFVRPELLEWKYFDANPLWRQSRSYLLLKDGKFAAHGCISPFQLAVTDQSISAMQITDWASGREVPGGGLLLYRNCLALTDVLVAIGGSDDTQRLISMVKWFRELDPIRLFARPLKPFRQIAASRSHLKRDLARFGRSAVWSLWPSIPDSADWSCKHVQRFERTIEAPCGAARMVRSPEWLNYLLRCPVTEMLGFELFDRERWRGHLLVSNVGHQTRIVDLAIDGDEQQDWRLAVAAALHLVNGQADIFEIAGGSSLPALCTAFEQCGFRPRGTVPVYLADPKKKLHVEKAVELNLAIGDAFYLPDPSRPFWT